MRPEVSFIFGGISKEYDSSVSSLEHIIATYLGTPNIERRFDVKNIHHISRNDGLVRTFSFSETFTISDLHHVISGTGIANGRTLVYALDEIASCNEYVVNLLHGQFGEDGGIQTLAALLGLKGTFGDPQVASLTMNKYAMSSFVSSLLPSDIVGVPKTRLITAKDNLDVAQIANLFRGPIVVKPNSLGSSLLTEVFHEPATSGVEVVALIKEILENDSAALLQEFVRGDEYSCGCMIDSSNVVPLPVMKIKTDRGFFGLKEKSRKDMFDLEAVDDLNNSISARIKSAARSIASAIDLYNVVRFDFIVTPRSEIVFLECNYIPGMGNESIFPAMLEKHGMTVTDLIHWVALHSKQYTRKNHLIRGKIDVESPL
ncbi:MAG: D-alanine--D-alanine ligase [Mesorhizobium sp.]|uniref:D-alanine--D-alanine ligase family protein n=1 Tax=Mesorhizobium sp. M7A.F.Ca.ET.027.02.1.1 TaxID=2496655 RepID=UPI000FD4D886|nr:D-alanine--D-alanine ligase [Mesorhizobium sp. M7A.F.Ca.ET.027.02.1.1]RVD14548.1 D-alanine--D-alanine ligase [Mesorhizobium sp. M7A.F.Ca.ET.027.02.1.1]RWC23697.1 MAG: D-alanine--D-alanine ligase [Mesorhizobium sp.]RWC98957.1 MAG: D-alanine--D-alanine ligase [Mesorhizobium sp.]